MIRIGQDTGFALLQDPIEAPSLVPWFFMEENVEHFPKNDT